ncbi:hypothetical protein JTB14_019161 [Gonioctena quinquepunctata]|nr:hypothetical protein JTB14_019161 [Gonioctena quinquepunctata]
MESVHVDSVYRAARERYKYRALVVAENKTTVDIFDPGKVIPSILNINQQQVPPLRLECTWTQSASSLDRLNKGLGEALLTSNRNGRVGDFTDSGIRCDEMDFAVAFLMKSCFARLR